MAGSVGQLPARTRILGRDQKGNARMQMISRKLLTDPKSPWQQIGGDGSALKRLHMFRKTVISPVSASTRPSSVRGIGYFNDNDFAS